MTLCLGQMKYLKMSNTYALSNGERVKKTVIDKRVRVAKQKLLSNQLDDYGYNFCERCKINASQGIPLDCSHNVSVKEAQETGQSELAYDVNNMEVLCRVCHQKKDKLNINYGNE